MVRYSRDKNVSMLGSHSQSPPEAAAQAPRKILPPSLLQALAPRQPRQKAQQFGVLKEPWQPSAPWQPVGARCDTRRRQPRQAAATGLSAALAASVAAVEAERYAADAPPDYYRDVQLGAGGLIDELHLRLSDLIERLIGTSRDDPICDGLLDIAEALVGELESIALLRHSVHKQRDRFRERAEKLLPPESRQTLALCFAEWRSVARRRATESEALADARQRRDRHLQLCDTVVSRREFTARRTVQEAVLRAWRGLLLRAQGRSECTRRLTWRQCVGFCRRALFAWHDAALLARAFKMQIRRDGEHAALLARTRGNLSAAQYSHWYRTLSEQAAVLTVLGVFWNWQIAAALAVAARRERSSAAQLQALQASRLARQEMSQDCAVGLLSCARRRCRRRVYFSAWRLAVKRRIKQQRQPATALARQRLRSLRRCTWRCWSYIAKACSSKRQAASAELVVQRRRHLRQCTWQAWAAVVRVLVMKKGIAWRLAENYWLHQLRYAAWFGWHTVLTVSSERREADGLRSALLHVSQQVKATTDLVQHGRWTGHLFHSWYRHSQLARRQCEREWHEQEMRRCAEAAAGCQQASPVRCSPSARQHPRTPAVDDTPPLTATPVTPVRRSLWRSSSGGCLDRSKPVVTPPKLPEKRALAPIYEELRPDGESNDSDSDTSPANLKSLKKLFQEPEAILAGFARSTVP
eukprot:TRINITY_DN51445_c0_g1_i1.p1 TRINITY_DN51445_c0_g1~~TRINITY_DN51445_c0_g1_i1.p1  ORF type:complete len:696 (-),score=129.37 TRINITY_DN51445_c0_g1_i1:61-2148(-)